MQKQFETEGEIVMWIAKQRAERPWLTETGLVAEAFALGYAEGSYEVGGRRDSYNRGHADGYEEGLRA